MLRIILQSGSNNAKKRPIVDILTPLLLVASSIARMSRKFFEKWINWRIADSLDIKEQHL
jgi:hypothetical protein